MAFAQTASDPTVAYFSTFDRAWELGLGALVAIAARPLGRADPGLRLVVALVGLVGVLVSLFVVRSSPGFPAPWALLPTFSTAAVLGAGAGLGSRSLLPLTNPVSQYVGKISYSLYLWHFPVVVLIVAVVAQYSAGYWVGPGTDLRAVRRLVSPNRRSSAPRGVVPAAPGKAPDPRARLAKYSAACAATDRRGCWSARCASDRADQARAADARPDRAYPGHPSTASARRRSIRTITAGG